MRLAFAIPGGHHEKRAEMSRCLAEATSRTYISVGDILREEAEKDSDRGKEVADAINIGGLVATVGGAATCFPRSSRATKISGRTDDQLK